MKKNPLLSDFTVKRGGGEGENIRVKNSPRGSMYTCDYKRIPLQIVMMCVVSTRCAAEKHSTYGRYTSCNLCFLRTYYYYNLFVGIFYVRLLILLLFSSYTCGVNGRGVPAGRRYTHTHVYVLHAHDTHMYTIYAKILL